jgi:hypothetical protein
MKFNKKWLESHVEIISISENGKTKKHDTVEFFRTGGKSIENNRKDKKSGHIQKKST